MRGLKEGKGVGINGWERKFSEIQIEVQEVKRELEDAAKDSAELMAEVSFLEQ